MSTIRQIMECLNGDDSPIEIRDNESFSLPFMGEFKNELRMTIFSYANNFCNPREVFIEDIYYISTENPSLYDRVQFGTSEFRINSEVLFEESAVEVDMLKPQDYIEAYWKLIDMTDEFLICKEISSSDVRTYITLFNLITPTPLRKYYFSIGRNFFHWIDRLSNNDYSGGQ